MKKYLFILIILLPIGINKIMAQNVSINDTGNPPNSFSVLDVDCSSNDKGILIPRLTTTQRTSILGLSAAEEGLTVYDETMDSYFLWNGSAWVQFAMGGGTTPWSLAGNSITQGTNFLGTTNNAYLSIRTNDQERVRITTKGQIETLNPGYSVFIGQYAGYSDDLSNNQNVFIGYQVGYSNIRGDYNTAIGNFALRANQTASRNIAMGDSALYTQSFFYSGAPWNSNNVAIGNKALYYNQPNTPTNGIKNTAIGNDALRFNTTGYNNTALGYQAGNTITTGYKNTCIGTDADLINGSIYNSTAIGWEAIASAENQVRLGNGQVTSLYCKGATALTSNPPNVYVSDDGQIMKSNSPASSYSWSLTGNTFTNPTYFLGTTNDFYLSIRTNNTEKVRITTQGQIETYNTGYSVFIGEGAGNSDDLSDNQNVFVGYRAGLANTTGYNNVVIGPLALQSNTTGFNNTASGVAALYSNTEGQYNTASGFGALQSNTTGASNTASGTSALFANTTGVCNTALGSQAGNTISTGGYNTCIGYDADVAVNSFSNVAAIGWGAIASASNQVRLGNDMVTSFFCKGAYAASTSNAPNVYVASNGQIMRSTSSVSTDSWGLSGNTGTVAGTNFLGTTDNQALDFRTNGIIRTRITTKGQIETYNTGNSVFIGQGAGNSDDLSFNRNIFIGYRAGYSNTTGDYNTASGDSSLYFNTTGSYNTATGSEALRANTTGYFNTAIGAGALKANTTAYHNTAIGTTALRFNTSGGSNTAIGSAALQSNTTGDFNTASGYGALSSNTKGIRNTANGENALKSNTTAGQNIAIGSSALYTQSYNNYDATWESNNVAIGYEALYSNQPTSTTNGYWNTAIGNFTLRSNTTGSFNTASGVSALRSNTTGASNTASGVEVLYSNTTGVNNTASGVSALYANTTGAYNTATGSAALRLNTTGSSNTATGYQALFSNTTNGGNTASGYNALYANTTGYYNSASGYQALYANTTGYWNTAIGYNAGSNITTGANNIAIGNGANVLNGTNSNQIRIGNSSVTYAAVQVAWSVPSDKNWKSDIQSSNLGLDFICKLKPVSYLRTSDESQKREYGFIAQELSATLNESGASDNGMISEDSEGMYSVRYNDLLAPMVKAIQELKAENENLQMRIANLEKLLNK